MKDKTFMIIITILVLLMASVLIYNTYQSHKSLNDFNDANIKIKEATDNKLKELKSWRDEIYNSLNFTEGQKVKYEKIYRLYWETDWNKWQMVGNNTLYLEDDWDKINDTTPTFSFETEENVTCVKCRECPREFYSKPMEIPEGVNPVTLFSNCTGSMKTKEECNGTFRKLTGFKPRNLTDIKTGNSIVFNNVNECFKPTTEWVHHTVIGKINLNNETLFVTKGDLNKNIDKCLVKFENIRYTALREEE